MYMDPLAIHNTHMYICDRASKKGPSGHIKFDHLFQLCYIITKEVFKKLTRFFYHQ